MVAWAIPLRDQQRRLTRELILRAAADEIVEGGLEGLALQAVAERAGVSKRTLYNYFDSREALLGGINDFSDDLTIDHGGRVLPNGLDDLPTVLRANYRSWYAQGNVFEALLKVGAATAGEAAQIARADRRAALLAAVAEAAPDLDDHAVDEITYLVHAVASSGLYQRLVLEDGLEADRASNLVAWLFELITNALRNGNVPQIERGEK